MLWKYPQGVRSMQHIPRKMTTVDFVGTQSMYPCHGNIFSIYQGQGNMCMYMYPCHGNIMHNYQYQGNIKCTHVPIPWKYIYIPYVPMWKQHVCLPFLERVFFPCPP